MKPISVPDILNKRGFRMRIYFLMISTIGFYSIALPIFSGTLHRYIFCHLKDQFIIRMMKELRRNEDQSGTKAGIIIFILLKQPTFSKKYSNHYKLIIRHFLRAEIFFHSTHPLKYSIHRLKSTIPL